MVRPLLLLLAMVGLSLAACAAEPSEDDAESRRAPDHAAAVVAQPIVGGTADTTHPAVVMIESQSGPTLSLCSGTIVRVSGTTGTVLTAAHCFETNPTTVTVKLGPNFASPLASYVATNVTVYPTTSGAFFDDEHDLAVITFTGATGATPVLPIAPPSAYASLAPGAPFVTVGYGRVDAAGTVTNTQRNKISVLLDRFFASEVQTKSAQGATCFGDSGGAVVDSSTGSDRLIAVTQGGESCTANSLNVGVGFYAPEIAAWLRGQGLSAPDAPQPNGAVCAADSQCASTACVRFTVNTPSGSVIRDLCAPPLDNNISCQRPAQCKSRYCGPGGGCTACSTTTHCGGNACVAGVCQGASVDAGAGADAGAGVDGGPSVDGGGTDAAATDAASSDAAKSEGGSGGSEGGSAGSGGEEPPVGEAPTAPTVQAPGTTPQGDKAPQASDGCSLAPARAPSGPCGAIALLTLVVALTRVRSRPRPSHQERAACRQTPRNHAL